MQVATANSHRVEGESDKGQWIAVHETFAKVAAENPEAVAVVGPGHRLTYSALQEAAAIRAAALRDAGVISGDLVAVLSELEPGGLIDAIATLMVGAGYVPIDPGVGATRIAAVVAASQVAAVLSSPMAVPLVADLNVPVLSRSSPLLFTATAPPPTNHQNAAYVIYTSGSTGEPKGVVVEHANLAAMTDARRSVYCCKPTFLAVSPLAFDSSAAGIWGTLTAGGTLILADRDDVRDPARLVDLIASHSVTHLLCIPVLYGAVLRAAARRTDDPLGSLEVAIVAGEALPDAVVQAHFSTHRHAVELVNEYGPTEATIWATFHRFLEPGPVSIGDAVPGVVLHVLDGAGKPAAPGEPGELHIGGAGVARGYLGRPSATAAAFVPDPFVGGGARMYRTGDRVRRRPDGALEFLGRRDQQVKVRGHRVELGTVEAAVHAAIPQSHAVVVLLDTKGALRAYVETGDDVDDTAVLACVRNQLGDVATPATLTPLDALPRTLGGKIDRIALAANPAPRILTARPPELVAGMDWIAAVARAWRTVLRRDDIATNVAFFEMGGTSFAIFDLQDALEVEIGRRPDIIDLYRYVTIADQAAHLVREDNEPPDAPDRSTANGTDYTGVIRRHRRHRDTP